MARGLSGRSLPLTCGVNPRHFHRLDLQGRCWIDFPDFQDWTSRWGFWTLRLDFWTSRLDFLDFRVSQERFWKHFRRPKYVQIQTFAENVFFSKSAQNTAPASKNQGFSCQERVGIIENRQQNRSKNSVIDKCAFEDDVFSIWQVFWSVLERFWGILGHFWAFSEFKREPPNQVMLNRPRFSDPQRVQAGFQGRFLMGLERSWVVFSQTGARFLQYRRVRFLENVGFGRHFGKRNRAKTPKNMHSKTCAILALFFFTFLAILAAFWEVGTLQHGPIILPTTPFRLLSSVCAETLNHRKARLES